MIEIGIVGGTGYTGVELLRILAQHPRVRIRTVTSRGDAGKAVGEVYPSLRGFVDASFVEPSVEALDGCELVFFATPNGTAMRMAPALLARGARVIDLAADFRLRDPDIWAEWYGESHTSPELLPGAVYGLPELQRSVLQGARLVACPGCYPTAVQLGLAPLIEAGAVQLDHLIADVKSGVSGAGRKAELSLLMSESGESFKAYNAGRHRHWPEIVQGLERMANERVGFVFVPHLVPMIRGIHATLYAELNDPGVDLQALYQQRYGDEPFVDVLPAGSHPDTRSVRGANACQIAVHRPHGRPSTVVVLSVIDNLVKGAAGQAVQCLNAIYGWEETLGLRIVGLYP